MNPSTHLALDVATEPPAIVRVVEKVHFRWEIWRVTVDLDIAARHAPKELRAIQEAGAVLPHVDVTTVIKLMKAQQDRLAPWMP